LFNQGVFLGAFFSALSNIEERVSNKSLTSLLVSHASISDFKSILFSAVCDHHHPHQSALPRLVLAATPDK
jgi:hypothetical protein